MADPLGPLLSLRLIKGRRLTFRLEFSLGKSQQQDKQCVTNFRRGFIDLRVEGMIGVDDESLLLAKSVRAIHRTLRDGLKIQAPTPPGGLSSESRHDLLFRDASADRD